MVGTYFLHLFIVVVSEAEANGGDDGKIQKTTKKQNRKNFNIMVTILRSKISLEPDIPYAFSNTDSERNERNFVSDNP